MKKGNLLLVLVFALISLTFCNNKNVEVSMQEESEQAVNMAMKNDLVIPTEKPKKMKENLSGEIILLNDEEFVSMITEIDNPKGFQYKGQTPCIVDFYADWCRPCIALSPILADIAKEYKGKIIIYKINVDKSGNVSKVFGIKSIPTLMFFQANAAPTQIVGAPTKEELTKAIEDVFFPATK